MDAPQIHTVTSRFSCNPSSSSNPSRLHPSLFWLPACYTRLYSSPLDQNSSACPSSHYLRSFQCPVLLNTRQKLGKPGSFLQSDAVSSSEIFRFLQYRMYLFLWFIFLYLQAKMHGCSPNPHCDITILVQSFVSSKSIEVTSFTVLTASLLHQFVQFTIGSKFIGLSVKPLLEIIPVPCPFKYSSKSGQTWELSSKRCRIFFRDIPLPLVSDLPICVVDIPLSSGKNVWMLPKSTL